MAENENYEWHRAASIVRDAGGMIVGRTKLQKIAYLLYLAGYDDGFRFSYHHYGPYSEDLSEAIRAAEIFDLVTEEERTADWGGKYSIYTAIEAIGAEDKQSPRGKLASKAVEMNSIELELAATAAYLASEENIDDPWQETEKRKPEKARDDHLENAKKAYQELCRINTEIPLPELSG